MRPRNPSASLKSFVDRIRRIDDSIHRLERENAALRDQLAGLREEIRPLAPALEEIREFSVFTARRTTMRRSTVRVAFLVHNPSAWGSIADVVRIMLDDPEFEPVLISIPHHYSGVGPLKGEKRVHRLLKAEGLPHIRLTPRLLSSAPALLRTLEPDIVFRQSQWDVDIDRVFGVDQLRWTRSVLIPYETMNIVENRVGHHGSDSAVDSPLHREAWLVFLANEEAAEAARRMSRMSSRQFRAVGHPKFDRLRATIPRWPVPHAQGIPPRRRVLWSAHHSILEGWNDFGLFPRTHEDMLEWARKDTETDFVFIRHPLLVDTIRRPGGPLSLADYERWLESWCSLPNATHWRGDYAQALRATDYLITDSPSMIIEGQIVDKPTVFLEREGHMPFNPIGSEIAKGVHSAQTVADAMRTIAHLDECGTDPLAAVRARNVERFFGQPGAAQRIVDTIRSEISSERG